MNKFILSALIAIGSASVAYGMQKYPAQAAELGIDSLKSVVVNSFVQKANNSKSPLHKFLEEFNQEHTDGRNPKGVLPKTFTANDIKVVSITGENQFGRYCSNIPNKPGHLQCSNGVSETYFILIPYKMGVRKAVEYDSVQFIVEAKKDAVWKMDSQEKEYDRRETIKIGEPIQAAVKAVADNAKKSSKK
jgi:hypothetical protein